MELDKTFEERDMINRSVVSAIDEAALNWGVKVLRYEIKDLTPPAVILQAMQQQITAEREKRAVVAASEGKKLEQINLATGAREAAIAQSERAKSRPRSTKPRARLRQRLRLLRPTAEALKMVADATKRPGGMNAANLQVAQRFVESFGELAKAGNTLIVPANLADVSSLVSSAMTIVKGTGGAAGTSPSAVSSAPARVGLENLK